MSEKELCREIKSGAFSMQVADCERNIRIQFEQLQQENKKYKEVIDKAIKFIDDYMYDDYGYIGYEDELKDILKEVK